MTDWGLNNLWLFVLAGWALNLTPGPDVFYMVTHAAKGGWRAGVTAAAGITAGCMVHVVAAAVGLSALIASSSAAFTALKWVGAAYLVYVGWGMLRAKAPKKVAALEQATAPEKATVGSPDAPAQLAAATDRLGICTAKRPDHRAIFRHGFWTNVLNPKVALFFLAFLPQFIDANAAHPARAFLALGLLFNMNALPINLGYVALAAWVGQRADALQRGMVWLERAAGAVFIGFGVRLALSQLSVASTK